MKLLISLVSGVIFGIGLVLSGMTDRIRVLNFLDIAGVWDPSLAFVMGSALLITIPGFYFSRKSHRPVFGTQFFEPIGAHIDIKLLSGATCFGFGWGLYGLCPGPAISSLIYGRTDIFLFLSMMVAGMVIEKWLSSIRNLDSA